MTPLPFQGAWEARPRALSERDDDDDGCSDLHNTEAASISQRLMGSSL